MAYVRKTEDQYTVQGFYGSAYGWEDVDTLPNRREARESIKVYRENMPEYRYRIVRRRVRKDVAA